MNKKLRKGSKVLIPDIIRYRFSSGELGAGKKGKVVRMVRKRKALYVQVNEDIYWYDESEVIVL